MIGPARYPAPFTGIGAAIAVVNAHYTPGRPITTLFSASNILLFVVCVGGGLCLDTGFGTYDHNLSNSPFARLWKRMRTTRKRRIAKP